MARGAGPGPIHAIVGPDTYLAEEALEKLWSRHMRSHHSETWGDDNGFSHLRASFLGPSITVPVHQGGLVLGTWQQIVVIDHDNNPRQRKVFVQVIGE